MLPQGTIVTVVAAGDALLTSDAAIRGGLATDLGQGLAVRTVDVVSNWLSGAYTLTANVQITGLTGFAGDASDVLEQIRYALWHATGYFPASASVAAVNGQPTGQPVPEAPATVSGALSSVGAGLSDALSGIGTWVVLVLVIVAVLAFLVVPAVT